MNEAEKRIANFWMEVRAKKNLRLAGKILYNSLSENLGGFVENLEPGCFKNIGIGKDDIRFLLGHDATKPQASTQSGTLRLRDTARALEFEVDLPDTTAGRDLHEDVRVGNFKQMSFGMIVNTDTMDVDANDVVIRTITDATLLELSCVVFPAYKSTSVEARNKTNTWVNEMKKRQSMTRANEYLTARFDNRNHDEFIEAVTRAGVDTNSKIIGHIDHRLVRASGLNTGKFITPPGFMDRLLFSEYSSHVVKRVNFLRVGNNKILLPQVLSKDRSEGQYYQGLTTYQILEADSITATKPQLEQLN